ncbi:MAG: 50S ribosomal protein L18 [Chloroflexi bacterium]|nr:50S ribosomal protein L18 [Chloroflexota bacterium]
MAVKSTPRIARLRRHVRVRQKVSGMSARPRLAVFRSLDHIYAQVIDDSKGQTLVSASTLDAELKEQLKDKSKTGQAELVGVLAAKRALGAGIKQVVFDRGGFLYHGRVKALAEAARKEGLIF